MLSNKQRKIARKANVYYIPDGLNLPRVTVCIVCRNKVFSRGLALCSVKTIPDPLEGAFFAWKNAMRAANKERDDRLILRDEAIEVIKSLKSTLWTDKWDCRAQYNIEPENGIEKKMFKKYES
jgi:hypothetical protein